MAAGIATSARSADHVPLRWFSAGSLPADIAASWVVASDAHSVVLAADAAILPTPEAESEVPDWDGELFDLIADELVECGFQTQ